MRYINDAERSASKYKQSVHVVQHSTALTFIDLAWSAYQYFKYAQECTQHENIDRPQSPEVRMSYVYTMNLWRHHDVQGMWRHVLHVDSMLISMKLFVRLY